MKKIIDKLKRNNELKKELRTCLNELHSLKRKVDGIDFEMDLVREGKLKMEDNELYIGSLLHKKIKHEQEIVNVTYRIVDIENTLKGLF